MVEEKAIYFNFPDCGNLPLPILHVDDVSFSYSGKTTEFLYKKLDLSVDLDSRIALVGPNGAGNSPLPTVPSFHPSNRAYDRYHPSSPVFFQFLIKYRKEHTPEVNVWRS